MHLGAFMTLKVKTEGKENINLQLYVLHLVQFSVLSSDEAPGMAKCLRSSVPSHRCVGARYDCPPQKLARTLAMPMKSLKIHRPGGSKPSSRRGTSHCPALLSPQATTWPSLRSRTLCAVPVATFHSMSETSLSPPVHSPGC